MAQKIDPASDRLRACRKAIDELIEQHGTGNAAAKATGLRQQSISALINYNQLGIDFADDIARVYETTVDGLVWKFIKTGDGEVRAGNVPGWAKAVEEARSQWGDSEYGLAAEIILPTAPRFATARFAYDLAQIFHMHVKSSSVRPAVRKVGG